MLSLLAACSAYRAPLRDAHGGDFAGRHGTTKPLGVWDPLGLIGNDATKYRRWQEMEIKHGRFAMAGTLHVILTMVTRRNPRRNSSPALPRGGRQPASVECWTHSRQFPRPPPAVLFSAGTLRRAESLLRHSPSAGRRALAGLPLDRRGHKFTDMPGGTIASWAALPALSWVQIVLVVALLDNSVLRKTRQGAGRRRRWHVRAAGQDLGAVQPAGLLGEGVQAERGAQQRPRRGDGHHRYDHPRGSDGKSGLADPGPPQPVLELAVDDVEKGPARVGSFVLASLGMAFLGAASAVPEFNNRNESSRGSVVLNRVLARAPGRTPPAVRSALAGGRRFF